VASGPVLALTEATKKAVAAFKAAHPEWKDEFMPFEQDCIDSKTNDKQCETAVKEQLADLEEEIKLQASKKQTSAKEAQANAKEAQIKKESEMINRTTIVTVVLQLNNSIQHGNPDRSGIAALSRIKNPIFQDDITFMRSIDTKLIEKRLVTPQETAKLQTILMSQAQESLRIYSSFTPEQQQEFISTKTIAT
jgi:cell pole-organizing protein PopZ